MDIKLIEGFYYLVERHGDRELFNGDYEGLYIVDGKPHTGLSTGDIYQDIEFLFKNNLKSDYLKNITTFHTILPLEEANEMFSYYINGKLYNSTDEYSHYMDGKLISDKTINGCLIVLGRKFTGVYNDNKTYVSGKLAEGIVLESKLEGLYRKGIRMIGHYTYENKDYYLFDDIELFNKNVIFENKLYYRGLLVKNYNINYGICTECGSSVYKTNSDGSLNEYRTKDGVCYKNNKLLNGYNIIK